MGVNGIYGLSGSGLDIESLVKVGMMGKKKQLEKMQQTYTKNEWKKETFLDVYDKINDYNLSTLSNFKLSSTTNARSATSSNPIITATANASAPVMNHKITVDQTATNAFFVGTTPMSGGGETKLGAAISFTLGDGTDTGVALATYSSASISSNSDFLSTNAGKFTTFLQGKYDDAIDLYDYESTETALSITLNDGINSAESIEITYGDIAQLLTNEDATVQDFVDLLNKKIKTSEITASYEYDSTTSTSSLKFTHNVASSTATVNVDIFSGVGTLGGEILSSLGATADALGGYYLNASNTTGGSPASFSNEGAATTINLAATASYYDLVSAINNAGTNVRATFDEVQKKFSIYNTKTGSNNSVTIQANNLATETLFNSMGLKDAHSQSNVLKFDGGVVNSTQGKDASVTIDGDRYTEINSNTLNVNGVIYNFGNVTEKTTSVVSVSQDKEKIIENVKSFVDSYNKFIGELNEMYREKPNSSYAPLTDAQKAEMTEDQIKKWEEKAKAGMLYHDSTLRKIITNMRTALSDQIGSSSSNSKYKTAYSIGISSKGLEGQIQLDENKLRNALADDPDSVYKIFAYEDKENSKNNGMARRLYDTLNDNALKSIKQVAGTSKDTSDDSQLSTLLRNLQTRMSSFQSMMNSFEESLYKKYDAMESALAMLGSQLNYVTGMFAQ